MPAPVAQAIQLILAPAVMVSACGLVFLSLQNRYGRINDRLRSLARERVDLLPRSGEPLAAARLSAIDRQLPDLLRRLCRQRDAILCLLTAIAAFVAASLLIAASLLFSLPLWSILAGSAFALGMLLVLAGVLLAASEICISARAVSDEVDEIRKLA